MMYFNLIYIKSSILAFPVGLIARFCQYHPEVFYFGKSESSAASHFDASKITTRRVTHIPRVFQYFQSLN